MENTAIISPEQITQLKQVAPEDIEKLSEGIIEVAQTTSRANDALRDLSASLGKLREVREQYDKLIPGIKNTMRDLAVRI